VQGAIENGDGVEGETLVPGPIPMLGRTLMTDYLLAFEVASVLLLVALIGAVIIAREEPAE
jgi:NADH:ubiquinone oxidoreductase subunit 6 (subunit J)